MMDGENIKLVVFDLNHTLIDGATWPKLQAFMGMTPEEDQVLWSLNAEGIIPNQLWLQIVNNLYRQRSHRSHDELVSMLLDYTFLPGAKEVVQALKQRYELAFISGAPDIVVEDVASKLGVKLWGSNVHLLFDHDGNFQELISLHEEATGKLIHLRSFCRQLNIRPDQVVCIGDGANDAELFKATGHGITFTGSTISDLAWHTVDNLSDITNL